MQYVTTKAQLPDDSHFAALVFSSIHIPGDERSRTHPGHGYPAENRAIVQYIAFASYTEMQKWIEEQERLSQYHIIEAFPRRVKKAISVELE